MIDARFAAALAAFLALGGLAAWPLVGRLPGGETGLFAGLAFSFASLVLGLAGIRWGLTRSPRHLMIVLLGSMAARVVALVVFALLLAFVTGAHLPVALLSVVTAHLVIGGVEIAYLKRTGAFE